MSSSADSWSCIITLRSEYDDKGTPLPGGPTTRQFGPVLEDKNQFEISLRRAQAAILNPDLPPERFLQMNIQQLKDAVR